MNRSRYYIIKRAIDLAGATVGIVLFSPVMILLAIAIKLSSRGPVFYRGERVGIDGKQFRIFKFRTMVEYAEQAGGPSTANNDPRLTLIGRNIRKYKLDELPQLFNILKGEMSLVGPRPQVAYYTDLYTDKEKRILDIRPGLTDYASIQFINLDEFLGDGDVDEKYKAEVEPEKNKLRLKYVDDLSFTTDIRILWKTILSMVGVQG